MQRSGMCPIGMHGQKVGIYQFGYVCMHEDIENAMLAIWQSNLARLGQGTAIGVGGRLREIIAKEKDSLKGIYVYTRTASTPEEQ